MTTGAEVVTGSAAFTINTGIDQSLKVAGFTRLNIVDGDLQQKVFTQTGAWADPDTGNLRLPKDGRRVLIYNSTQAAYREYVYMNSGWRYSEYT